MPKYNFVDSWSHYYTIEAENEDEAWEKSREHLANGWDEMDYGATDLLGEAEE